MANTLGWPKPAKKRELSIGNRQPLLPDQLELGEKRPEPRGFERTVQTTGNVGQSQKLNPKQMGKVFSSARFAIAKHLRTRVTDLMFIGYRCMENEQGHFIRVIYKRREELSPHTLKVYFTLPALVITKVE